ncbi:MAG: cyclic peptide export ABC transporter [Elainellaceae cyanobacterium]
MTLLLFVVRHSPGITGIALVTALLSGLLSGGLIALIHRVLDQQNLVSTQLGLWFLLLVGLTLVSAIAANIVIAYLYRKVLLDLQMQLARKITQAPLRQLEEVGASPLLVILTEDVDSISDAVTELVPLIINLVTAIACFSYLVWLSWQAFASTLVFLLVGGISYRLLIRREQKVLERGRDRVDDLYRYFQDLTAGVKELKLNQSRAQAFLNQVLEPTARAVQKYLFLWDVAYTVISAWGRFLILVVVGLMLFLLPRYLPLEPGVLTGYVLVLLYVRSSLLAVMDALPNLAEAAVALDKVKSAGLSLSAEPKLARADSRDSVRGLASWQTLRLAGVTHRYYREREDNFFALGPIDLTFTRGELVFLVGGNGSGKTTLAKLITGLYAPESGGIYLNETQICDRTRAQYSQLFSAVFADFHLFGGLSGLNDKRTEDLDAQAQHYLAKLQLDHKVTIQAGQLSTIELSRGQQQRLALLAAYLEDRSFYIFDEWASNQDPVFKAVFYKQFLPELKARGKTVLVISHDDHYFHLGDRVLKLIDGKLDTAIEYRC